MVLQAVDLLTLIIDELPARRGRQADHRRDRPAPRADGRASTPLIAGGDAAAVEQSRGGRSRRPPARRDRRGDDRRRRAARARARTRRRLGQGRHRKLDNLSTWSASWSSRSRSSPRIRRWPLRRRATHPAPGAAQADHQRPAAQRDVDAHGADPPDVPEDGAAGPRLSQASRARRSSWCCTGEETELDRKVVEDINDPLMHMVRNSVDHGIETRERRAGRRQAGARRRSRSAPSTRAATSSSRSPTTAPDSTPSGSWRRRSRRG